MRGFGTAIGDILRFWERSLAGQTIHGRDGLRYPLRLRWMLFVRQLLWHQDFDSYRWLEDGKSDQTPGLHRRGECLHGPLLSRRASGSRWWTTWAIWKTSRPPVRLAARESYFFRKRLAGEQQFSIYVRQGWAGKDKRLVDPAVLSKDPNLSVRIEDVSRDGKLLAYAVQQGGADEQRSRIECGHRQDARR